MLKVITAVLAENAIRDFESNRFTLVNLFEDMSVQGFPFLFPILTLYLRLGRNIEENDPPTYQCRIAYLFNGKEIVSRPIEINFIDKAFYRGAFKLAGYTTTSPGTMEVWFGEDGKEPLTKQGFKIEPPAPEIKLSEGDPPKILEGETE